MIKLVNAIDKVSVLMETAYIPLVRETINVNKHINKQKNTRWQVP